MADDKTRLSTAPRDIEGSRTNRRLRREGRVPAVLYGGGEEPQHFSVDARDLRHALHGSGAVIELDVDGSSANAVVKDIQQHPVRGEAMHIDFVRVRMDVAIQAVVTVELTGVDGSPGTTEGGVLEQQTRELNIEALPGDIPESIEHDASALEMNATVTLADLSAPKGVTFLDDPETVIASITLPRLEVEEPEVETETELVGEDGEPIEGEAAEGEAAEGGDDAAEGEQPDTTSE